MNTSNKLYVFYVEGVPNESSWMPSFIINSWNNFLSWIGYLKNKYSYI